MILADSSVWIDYFRRLRTPVTGLMDAFLGSLHVVIGEVILTEVLQASPETAISIQRLG